MLSSISHDDVIGSDKTAEYEGSVNCVIISLRRFESIRDDAISRAGRCRYRMVMAVYCELGRRRYQVIKSPKEIKKRRASGDNVTIFCSVSILDANVTPLCIESICGCGARDDPFITETHNLYLFIYLF